MALVTLEYYQDIIKRKAIVNAGVKFILKNQITKTSFETFEYDYESFANLILFCPNCGNYDFLECDRAQREQHHTNHM